MNGAQELDFETVADSMRRLAIAGLKPCQNWLKQSPQPNLQPFIYPDENKIRYELGNASLKAGKARHFHPLPAPKKGFHLAFFKPLFVPGSDPLECKIEVIMVTDTAAKEMVGFRFERGLEPDDTHAYPHVQLTRTFRGGPATNWPTFTPESYPALPTRCHAPGNTWLAVLVSLYGLSKSAKLGLEDVIAGVEIQLNVELRPKLMPRSRHIFAVAA